METIVEKFEQTIKQHDDWLVVNIRLPVIPQQVAVLNELELRNCEYHKAFRTVKEVADCLSDKRIETPNDTILLARHRQALAYMVDRGIIENYPHTAANIDTLEWGSPDRNGTQAALNFKIGSNMIKRCSISYSGPLNKHQRYLFMDKHGEESEIAFEFGEACEMAILTELGWVSGLMSYDIFED